MLDYLELDLFAFKITHSACIFFTLKILKAKRRFDLANALLNLL